MPTPNPRLLSLAILILAGVEVGLPWAAGGRSPAGQAGLILLMALAAAAASLARGTSALLRPSPLLGVAAILAAASAFHTIHPDRTVQYLLLLLSYALAGIVAYRGAREGWWAERLLLHGIAVAGVPVTGFGLLPLFLAPEVGVYARVPTGPFGYPNAMAGYLLLTAGAALALAGEPEGRVTRSLAVAGGALMMAALVLTRSQGALLAALAGFAVWAAFERYVWWERRRLWLAVAGLAAGLILVSVLNRLGVLPARLWMLPQPSTGATDTSFLWRLHILRWTWAMVRNHPWWGVGPGAFPVALTHYQRLPYVSGVNPHNLYLEVAAEYGLPAAAMAGAALGGFLWRVGATIRRAPGKDPGRRRLTILLATLVAFAAHSAVDLDWSFPAIAVTAATLLGLAGARVQGMRMRRPPVSWAWRVGLLLLLAAAALLALSRYFSTVLETEGRSALAAGQTVIAQSRLAWALRLNPLSFPARQWLARALLLSGDPRSAEETARGAARIAPLDPNSQYLAGEIAAAAGRWEVAVARFQRAVDRAPFAQLRFHVSLVEAAARTGKVAEARWSYEQAMTIFPPEAVLAREARCLAPGDRYLLARMSRIATRLYAEAGETNRERAAADQARRLAEPDPRGICANQGRPDQTSPEVTVERFWQALGQSGWGSAGRFLAPELRRDQSGEAGGAMWFRRAPPRARVSRIDALTGWEREVTLRFALEVETPSGLLDRCGRANLRLIGDAWFLENIPVIESNPCQP